MRREIHAHTHAHIAFNLSGFSLAAIELLAQENHVTEHVITCSRKPKQALKRV